MYIAYEIYYSSDKNKEKIIDCFQRKLDTESYYCNYGDFIRVGFKDTKQSIINSFLNEIKALNLVDKCIKRNVPKWHEETELMKYAAYGVKITLDAFFEIHEKTLKHKIKSREYNSFKYPIDKEKRAIINPDDWMTIIHHLFNLYEYEYDKEVYILNKIANQLHYNAHVTK